MTLRTTSKIVTFARPFTLRGVGRLLPAGNYPVVTDEELIEELSFPVYRRGVHDDLRAWRIPFVGRDGGH